MYDLWPHDGAVLILPAGQSNSHFLYPSIKVGRQLK